ncbi:hypothetical protein KM043_013196 [Ampulex compressa]|nr:hypothetical protein KM043_013196 [Ampulex compressa]
MDGEDGDLEKEVGDEGSGLGGGRRNKRAGEDIFGRVGERQGYGNESERDGVEKECGNERGRDEAREAMDKILKEIQEKVNAVRVRKEGGREQHPEKKLMVGQPTLEG